MPYAIEKKLVVAVASSALFDLTESNRIFEERGVDAYRTHQRENQENPLGAGVALPFIRRFLTLNHVDREERPVEVLLLSRNDPDTGLRVFNSIKHHQLDISRGAFLNGTSPHLYMKAFNVSLFLSSNHQNVAEAIQAGHPAGLVLDSAAGDDRTDNELRVAFDFDGVLADDEAEAVYHTTRDVDAFHAAETEKASIPHAEGPLRKLFTGLAELRSRVGPTAATDVPRIRIALITARNAPSHKRLVTTLRELNVQPDETFFLGGIEKHRILDVFRPHMFFDDQLGHLEPAAKFGAMVHVPFGIKNRGEQTDAAPQHPSP